MTQGIQLVGFDADDTLWRSQDYFDEAQRAFEGIVGHYVDLGDGRVADALYAVESANIAVFGYGVKGMALSMIESATQITDGRISARDLHRIVDMAKALLRHPVELLPGIRAAVEAIAARFEVVLITKGDLFHQEQKGYRCKVRAKRHKVLIYKDCAARGRRNRRRSCGPMRPLVAHSCHGFATVSGAA